MTSDNEIPQNELTPEEMEMTPLDNWPDGHPDPIDEKAPLNNWPDNHPNPIDGHEEKLDEALKDFGEGQGLLDQFFKEHPEGKFDEQEPDNPLDTQNLLLRDGEGISPAPIQHDASNSGMIHCNTALLATLEVKDTFASAANPALEGHKLEAPEPGADTAMLAM